MKISVELDFLDKMDIDGMEIPIEKEFIQFLIKDDYSEEYIKNSIEDLVMNCCPYVYFKEPIKNCECICEKETNPDYPYCWKTFMKKKKILERR